MAEDLQLLIAKFMKKEKLIKDIMRNDARAGYQFVSAVKRELEKEKNIMAAKLYFLYRLSHIFAPNSPPRSAEEAQQSIEILHKIMEEQITYVAGWVGRAEQKSAPEARSDVVTGSQIKDIIQDYMETKNLLKAKIKDFILTRRSGVVQNRLAEVIREMKAAGGIEKVAGQTPVDEFLKKRENLIVVELILDEMAEKTASLDKAVNRIVEWRTRTASAPPPNPSDAERLDQEKNLLVMDLVREIEHLREHEKLPVKKEGGILNSPEGRASLVKLKSNVNSQKVNVSVIRDLMAAGASASRPEEIQKNKEAAQNSCDKIEALIKEERDYYVNFRKWETDPEHFLEDMSGQIQIPS